MLFYLILFYPPCSASGRESFEGEIRSSQRAKQLLWDSLGSVPKSKHGGDPDGLWRCCCKETAEAQRLLRASSCPNRSDLLASDGHQGSLSTDQSRRRAWEEILWDQRLGQQISAGGTLTSVLGPLKWLKGSSHSPAHQALSIDWINEMI